MRRLFSLAACLLLVFSLAFLSACARQSERNPAEGKPIIAVSIVPERTFVEAVCGDLVEVITMIPPGNSPENYEPVPEIMEKFNDAEVYFAIGVPTEQANILPIAGDVAIVSLHDEVESVYPERTFSAGERDPHIWLSPKRVKVMIDIIAREMAMIDPNNADTYHLNAKAYNKQLDELDNQIIDALSGLTVRKFVVYHPAFGYLADDYGLEMFALEDEGKEATPQHLQSMIDLAKEESIKVIFYQEEIDSSQSKAFAEELGGTTVKLAPLAADYIDNLMRMAEALAEGIQ